jgi:hypothetical protein
MLVSARAPLYASSDALALRGAQLAAGRLVSGWLAAEVISPPDQGSGSVTARKRATP